jgi:ATP-binding cassette subfamily F protein 3
VLGHQVVPEYFAQDEAMRLTPTLTVYETLASGSPLHMVPAIRNLLGGFLFSGDDVYKKAAVLSGGERTRLAVARMLLRPSNLLLLDEPTNHLDLDSKDVLLDALVDYGGTLIFVSHDRYFVERLATRIIEVGHGRAESFPGTYLEFLWRKEHMAGTVEVPKSRGAEVPKSRGAEVPKSGGPEVPTSRGAEAPTSRGPEAPTSRGAEVPKADSADRKAAVADQRKRDRERKARKSRLADLETRIAAHETAIKALEAEMSTPGFYDKRDEAQARLSQHQTLMWEVGELMQQWEMLSETDESDATK